MATTDHKRAALVRALMERDLYDMLGVSADAGADEITTAIARRREEVEETPMRAAARDAEMHWLAWAERALVNDPEIRVEYDAARERAHAAEERTVEARTRVRRLHVARDQLARREAQRPVPVPPPAPPKKAPAPRKRAAAKSAAAADPAGAEKARLEATQITDADEALRRLEGVEGDTALAIALADRAVAISDDPEVLTRAGQGLRRAGEQDRAAALLRKAVEAGGSPGAYSALVAVLGEQGDADAARTVARAMTESHPESGLAWMTLAEVLADGGGDEAETAYVSAATLGPRPQDAVSGLRSMAATYRDSGDDAAAVRVEGIIRDLGVPE